MTWNSCGLNMDLCVFTCEFSPAQHSPFPTRLSEKYLPPSPWMINSLPAGGISVLLLTEGFSHLYSWVLRAIWWGGEAVVEEACLYRYHPAGPWGSWRWSRRWSPFLDFCCRAVLGHWKAKLISMCWQSWWRGAWSRSGRVQTLHLHNGTDGWTSLSGPQSCVFNVVS